MTHSLPPEVQMAYLIPLSGRETLAYCHSNKDSSQLCRDPWLWRQKALKNFGIEASQINSIDDYLRIEANISNFLLNGELEEDSFLMDGYESVLNWGQLKYPNRSLSGENGVPTIISESGGSTYAAAKRLVAEHNVGRLRPLIDNYLLTDEHVHELIFQATLEMIDTDDKAPLDILVARYWKGLAPGWKQRIVSMAIDTLNVDAVRYFLDNGLIKMDRDLEDKAMRILLSKDPSDERDDMLQFVEDSIYLYK